MVTRSQAHLHVACELAEPRHANETRHPLSFLVHCDQHRLAATSGGSPSNSATTFEFSNIFEYFRIVRFTKVRFTRDRSGGNNVLASIRHRCGVTMRGRRPTAFVGKASQ